MRKRMWAGVALAGIAMMTVSGTRAAFADKIKISPRAFQILGGIDDGGNSAASPASFSADDVPDDMRSRTIAFQSDLTPGSVLVRTGERMLYYILPDGKAIAYHVGVGREGFTWSGTNTVSRKAEWPEWRPPKEMVEREARRGRQLPEVMEGGPDNPLGARAIYIGDTQFRIHGTTQPWSIGKAMSSGCIRMMNEEVIDLYDRVAIGATVVVEE